MKILGFIPARGGSKGIPGKNLVPLLGKPMLHYTIEAARGSRALDDVFLSSDDEAIIESGRRCGLAVNYRRPADLSGDRALVVDAALDAIDWLEDKGTTFDAVALLQPTSPLRTASDIDGALELFRHSGTQSLVGVHRMLEHPYECIKGKKEGWRWLDKSSKKVAGRQEYDQDFYYVNGAIYVAEVDLLRRKRSFIEEGKSTLYPMDPFHGLDIDEPAQLALAEFWLAREAMEA